MQQRVIIENVRPVVDAGRYMAKRVVGERVLVTADILADGHDVIRAEVLYQQKGDKTWQIIPMSSLVNDAWEASFTPEKQGIYLFKVQAWIDHFSTWYKGFLKKHEAGQDMQVELQIGVAFLETLAKADKKNTKVILGHAASLSADYAKALAHVCGDDFALFMSNHPLRQHITEMPEALRIKVERPKALFSTWYEFFPRSISAMDGQHGTFKECEALLPRIAEMGFDTLYFPPIHPVGEINRKGKNNTLDPGPEDVGSPWAIGSQHGGHDAVNPLLGTMKDYESLIKKAASLGIEIALDLALQCAPDHPYIKQYPQWFVWRPDGSIAYAENPPKKYQDIVPINFECEDWQNLWNELKRVVLFWVKKGIKVFRVDNPHTKPIPFWEWLIAEVHAVDPDIIFLSEAFTRPKIMDSLAKVGFTQSYTYFTWRNNAAELKEYMTELTQGPQRDFFRPNFWPNTPDILPYFLQNSGPNGFHLRYALAATLSASAGVYGGAYDYYWDEPIPGKEEYWMSEKFELKHYDWSIKNRMTDLMTQLNAIRKANPALQTTWNIEFTATSNEKLLSFVKYTDDKSQLIWCIVNLDPHHVHSGYVEVPRKLLGMERGPIQLKVKDLMTGEQYLWGSDWNYVSLNPEKHCLHVMALEL
jgi:starch synthase (maltosyl-transferring)